MKKKKLIFMTMILFAFSIVFVGCGSSEDTNTTEDNSTDKGEKKTPVDEAINIDDATVKELYKYVSYGNDTMNRDYYFYKHDKITRDSLTGYEIHFYAYQLLSMKDVKVLSKGEFGIPEFSIGADVYDTAIKKLFGDVKYSRDEEYSWISHFAIEGSSGINFKFDKAKNAYIGTAGGVGGIDSVLLPFYGRLESATKNTGDNSITFTERVIFTNEAWDSTEGKLYSDETKKNLISDIKVGYDTVTVKDLDKYFEKGGSITYKFVLSQNNEYHFHSSQINK